MTSRPSRKKAQAALNELMRTPVTRDDYRAIRNELTRIRNDRGAAIIGASLVETALESRLLLNFRTLSSDDYTHLFQGDQAPLGTLSAKTKISYVMRLCSAAERDDLDCIRRIRNAFAHTLKRLSFETTEIADMCAHLKLGEGPTLKKTPPNWGARSQYLEATIALSNKFLGTGEERERLILARALKEYPVAGHKGLLSGRPPSRGK